MIDRVILRFRYEKATDNTHRFSEITDGTPVIGRLWVNKAAFTLDDPDMELHVVINVVRP